MKTPFILFYSFVVFPLLVCGQGPGYMGRKTVIGYGNHLNPVTFGSTANNKTLFGHANGTSETGYIRFNFTHELFLERALSKSWSIGASVKYLRTGFDNREDIHGQYLRPSDYYVINAFTYTPYVKKYSRRYIAPWGKYLMIGPSLSVMTSKHDEYMHIVQTVNNHDTLITNFGSDSQKYYRFDILLGTGMNRIYFNRITLDYGFNFQLLSMLSILEPLLLLTETPPDQEDYIGETIKPRVSAANRFNVFIKVAYLF